MSSLWIPGPLPGLNEIIAAASRRRGKWNAYAVMKRQWGGTVALLAQAQRVGKIEPGEFWYRFVEPHKRRDPSNVISGGIKIVEDALQEAGLLENDGWTHVRAIHVSWEVGHQPGVEVRFE